MSTKKEAAIDICGNLSRGNKMDYPDYLTVMDAICEFDTLAERDEELEALWEKFADVPVDPDTEKLEEQYIHFPAGTGRETVWHWFDERHSKGVAYLLYKDGVNRTDVVSKLLYLKKLCMECEGHGCTYNHRGECRFALVHERKPEINDIDGCVDYEYTEESDANG